MTLKKVLVIIPAYNEALSLPGLLENLSIQKEALKPKGWSLIPVVINDGSSDNTPEVARNKGAWVVNLPNNLGIGGAVQTGFKLALLHKFDFAIQLDGDGQHPPDQIEKLLEAYTNCKSNLIIGSRFLGDGGFQSTYSRRIGIKLIAFSIKCLFGLSATDPTSGFRLLDRKCLDLFSGNYPVDYPEPVSIGIAINRGLTVFETPVKMRERLFGKSSIRLVRSPIYFVKVVLNLFIEFLQFGNGGRRSHA